MTTEPVGKSLAGMWPQTTYAEKQQKYAVVHFPQVGYLSAEMMGEICKHLSLQNLGRLGSVCQTWKRIMDSDYVWPQLRLPKVFPQLNYIGPGEWDRCVDLEKYQLDTTGGSQTNNRTRIFNIKSLLDTKKIEGDAGFTHLTLPKGLTYSKLIEIAKAPKEGTPTKVYIVFERILENLDDTPILNTRELILSNNILSESQGKNFETLTGLVVQPGCKMPEVLPVATLAILTKIIKNVRLFDHVAGETENPWPFTLCSDLSRGNPLAVGDNTDSEGVRITYADFVKSGDGISRLGVGIQMELPSKEEI